MSARAATDRTRSITPAEGWSSIAFSALAPAAAAFLLTAVSGELGECRPGPGWVGPVFIAGAVAYALGVAALAVRLQNRGVKPSHALAVTVAQVPIALAILVFTLLEIAGSAGCFD